MQINFLQIVSAFIVLFAVIDILGSIPLILDLKKKGNKINAREAAIYSYAILVVFFFVGEPLLGLFGVDISSFAIAGSFVLLVMAFEMIFGIHIFKHDSPSGASIVPIAFPLVAGAGSFTTILSLRSEFDTINILIALTLNIIVVYLVLRSTGKVEKLIGEGGVYVLQKFFGIILLAMAIRLFLTNFANLITQFLPALKG
ncbi:MarC family protein [Saccharicrinis aurantiacus]|uniref:MarC family protein n=1 Tax=Saccharicrinis aurantiacus TaxID=1849719 RepID=UPI0024939685|nr:MarC family protein [Saccharicrinis aurantiacus]